MGFARLLFAILLFSAGFVCAETPFGMVYGKVVKQYSVPSADSDSLDFDAMLKLYDQVEAGRELTLKQPDLPENVRYMLSEPPIDPRKKAWNDLLITPDIEGGGDSTIVTQIQVLKVLDSTGNWVSVQDSTLKLYALEDTTRLTYNIKDHHFYKFGPVARIDSLPRVFRPHHFSRPVYETELYRFPYRELSEYTRFRQYIQLDTLNAPPLRSTLLRLVQEGKFKSIPPLLSISRQLRKKYGISPVRDEFFLALLSNDSTYLKNADLSEKRTFGGWSALTTLDIATQDSLTTPRLDEALSHVPLEVRKNIRKKWNQYRAERRKPNDIYGEAGQPDAVYRKVIERISSRHIYGEASQPDAVYGKVIERISSRHVPNKLDEWADPELGKQFLNALKKHKSQQYQIVMILNSLKGIPENELAMFYASLRIPFQEDKRMELESGGVTLLEGEAPENFVITRVQVLKTLDSAGKWVAPPKDSILNIYSFAAPNPEALTYSIQEGRFMKFGPIAVIDSQPRIFLRNHFSEPIPDESRLGNRNIWKNAIFTPYQQPVYMDPIDALPLQSTALRYIQNGLYDSIPELLKIDRQLREIYGVSPLQENESLLALLGNDADYFKTIGPHGMDNIPYIFRKSSSDDTSLRQKLIEAFIDPDNDYRFEKTIKVFPKDIRAQLRVARAYARGTYTYDQPLFESIVQTNADSVQDEKSRKRILNYLMLTENRPREKKAKPYLGQIYLYFGGEAQLLRNGAQKVFKSDHQMGINWMGIGGCVNSLCLDYEITYFFSKKTGEDHVVNDTLYNRENGDVRMSLLLEWRPIYNPRFDVRAYIGYNCNLYSFKIDSDFEVDKKHQYNNIGDFADFSLGGMLNFSPFEFELGQENGEWKIYTGFRLKAGYIFLNTPEFNHLKGGGVTAGFYVYVGV
ncbi:MAG: hypothetical protein MJY87_09900 [Fibrobacter sp.]|nr:hypothetical protein [Fibrobacter sp.]